MDYGKIDEWGANLSGADLGGADLLRANLWGANLRGADLRGANLSGANLGGADLLRANLWGANLRGADLRGANLWGADLMGANLSGADLGGANLSGANLMGADLAESTGVEYAQCAWTGHGEQGRQLLAVRIDGEIRFFCGCFAGNAADLIRYILDGDERYRESRYKAMDFLISCFKGVKND